MTVYSVNLVDTGTWEPQSIRRIVDGPAHIGPAGHESLPLGELTMSVAPATFDQPTRTVNPSGVDDISGAVRLVSTKTHVRGFEVADDSLHPGDVLVSVSGASPSILVTDEHRQLAFSPMFEALRPNRISSVALWAYLNSRSGREALRSLRPATSIPMTREIASDQLGEIGVPVPTGSSPVLVAAGNELPSPGIQLDAVSDPVSNWCLADLHDAPTWEWFLNSLDHVYGEQTAPLGELAEVFAGRVHQRGALTTPQDDALPLVTISNLTRGHEPDRWVVPDTRTRLIEAGDVLVPRHGSSIKPVVSDRDAVPAAGLHVVRPDEQHADSVRTYLASNAARRWLSKALTGSTVPHLSVRALRAAPVPLGGDDAVNAVPAGWQAPLSERLEELLWPPS